MPRPVEQFSQKALREKLTQTHGDFIITRTFLSSSDIARWLGQHEATVRRWRRDSSRGQDFPPPDSTVPVVGMKGSGMAYAWKPSTVEMWLRATGRLIP
jgi:transposase-like protein